MIPQKEEEEEEEEVAACKHSLFLFYLSSSSSPPPTRTPHSHFSGAQVGVCLGSANTLPPPCVPHPTFPDSFNLFQSHQERQNLLKGGSGSQRKPAERSDTPAAHLRERTINKKNGRKVGVWGKNGGGVRERLVISWDISLISAAAAAAVEQ